MAVANDIPDDLEMLEEEEGELEGSGTHVVALHGHVCGEKNGAVRRTRLLTAMATTFKYSYVKAPTSQQPAPLPLTYKVLCSLDGCPS